MLSAILAKIQEMNGEIFYSSISIEVAILECIVAVMCLINED